MKLLPSYLGGSWQTGTGAKSQLVNPTSEEVLAESTTSGLDVGGALDYARSHGRPALFEMTFKERGALLSTLANVIHKNREELLELAVQNGGNTRSDAKFDVDGAMGTLGYYGKLAERLGDGKYLTDGDSEQLTKSPRYAGRHFYVPKTGVAVHINAFNFPAWGLAEKAAVALLAGMPVLTKPATSTAMVAVRMVELFCEAQVLPDGALSLLAGGAGSLLDHLGGQDVLAFTGSAHTGAMLRRHGQLIERGVRVNIEADSLNAAVLGPDVAEDSDVYALFLREVVRDITQKAGQKCTAIRRVVVPATLAPAVRRDLADQIAGVVVGDPAHREVGMGPLATQAQLEDVSRGISALTQICERVFAAERHDLLGVPAGKGYFVMPHLFWCAEPHAYPLVHEREVFGPVATLMPYAGSADEAVRLLARGQGSLVASIYSDDAAFAMQVTIGCAPHHGRLHLASSKVAEHSLGPGTVLPQLVHGGPGRAGGGEELGGVRSMHFYMQRTAVQAYAPWLDRLAAGQ